MIGSISTQNRGVLSALVQQPPDSLLSLIKMVREDRRASKIDLGLGVYRDESGDTPVLKAVKHAEVQLATRQSTKSYLGTEGNAEFLELLELLVFGDGWAGTDLISIQTIGGSGALRVGAELFRLARPAVTIWVGLPTWSNHLPIFRAAGLNIKTYRHFQASSQTIDFESTMHALQCANEGDIVLLHGSCHNPSGLDFSDDQWAEVLSLLRNRNLLPFVDLAYHGFGEGLDADTKITRSIFETFDEAVLAYSCDKNFGLYRERTGALFIRTSGYHAAVSSNVLSVARTLWSMPSDHGAAIVATILGEAELLCEWRSEIGRMRSRLAAIRAALSTSAPHLKSIGTHKGFFSTLPLTSRQIQELREVDAIYVAPAGRINIAGLNSSSIARFAEATGKFLAANSIDQTSGKSGYAPVSTGEE